VTEPLAAGRVRRRRERTACEYDDRLLARPQHLGEKPAVGDGLDRAGSGTPVAGVRRLRRERCVGGAGFSKSSACCASESTWMSSWRFTSSRNSAGDRLAGCRDFSGLP